MLQTAPSTAGLFSSLAGGSGLHSPSDPAPVVPVFLSSALSDALNVSAPAAQATATAPVQGTATTAPAGPGAAAPAPAGYGDWTHVLPDWLQKVLFTDVLTGADGRTENSGLPGLLLLVVIFALGAGFVYFGVKLLSD